MIASIIRIVLLLDAGAGVKIADIGVAACCAGFPTAPVATKSSAFAISGAVDSDIPTV